MPSPTKPPPNDGGPGVTLFADRPRAAAAACRDDDPARSGLRSQAALTAARSRADASATGKAGGCGTGLDAGRAARWTGTALGSAGTCVAPGVESPRPGSGRLAADGAGCGAATTGAGLADRPAGKMACAPGVMKPCAFAAPTTHASAAAVSDAVRKEWEGMVVLVAGPQGGAELTRSAWGRPRCAHGPSWPARGGPSWGGRF